MGGAWLFNFHYDSTLPLILFLLLPGGVDVAGTRETDSLPAALPIPNDRDGNRVGGIVVVDELLRGQPRGRRRKRSAICLPPTTMNTVICCRQRPIWMVDYLTRFIRCTRNCSRSFMW